MLIFKGIMDKLPQFKKYWNHMFQNKSMPVVGECQSKVFPLARMRNNICSKEDDTKKETSAMIGEMAVTAAKALLSEMRYEKKATEEHMPSDGGRFCWDNTYDDYHVAGMFKMAFNYPAEIYFVAMKGQLQPYGKIGLNNTGGVSKVRVNGELLRGFDTV